MNKQLEFDFGERKLKVEWSKIKNEPIKLNESSLKEIEEEVSKVLEAKVEKKEGISLEVLEALDFLEKKHLLCQDYLLIGMEIKI